MTSTDIKQALFESGIKHDDILMIHGDAVVAAQLRTMDKSRRLGDFFSHLIDYFGYEGTLIVPTFTYSFPKNEDFNVQESESVVGQFSEYFRRIPGVVRSRQPIFSVAAIGKHKNVFGDSDITNCFGDTSVFGLLHKMNGKLMNLGCEFDITHAHFVEQAKQVNYRYFKEFSGKVIDGNFCENVTTQYFVRDTNRKTTLNLNKIKKLMISKNMFHTVAFGRFASYSVSCKDFYDCADFLLSLDTNSLIEEGADV